LPIVIRKWIRGFATDGSFDIVREPFRLSQTEEPCDRAPL